MRKGGLCCANRPEVDLPLTPSALCNADRLGRAELGEAVGMGGADLKLGGLAAGGSG